MAPWMMALMSWLGWYGPTIFFAVAYQTATGSQISFRSPELPASTRPFDQKLYQIKLQGVETDRWLMWIGGSLGLALYLASWGCCIWLIAKRRQALSDYVCLAILIAMLLFALTHLTSRVEPAQSTPF